MFTINNNSDSFLHFSSSYQRHVMQLLWQYSFRVKSHFRGHNNKTKFLNFFAIHSFQNSFLKRAAWNSSQNNGCQSYDLRIIKQRVVNFYSVALELEIQVLFNRFWKKTWSAQQKQWFVNEDFIIYLVFNHSFPYIVWVLEAHK